MAETRPSDSTPGGRGSGPASSILATVVAVAIGSVIAVAGGSDGLLVGGLSVFALCAAAAFALNWIAFVPSWLMRTERFYDLTGTLSYLAVVVLALIAGSGSTLSIVLAVLIGIWTIRLGSFLVRRIRQDGSDGRFDEIKVDPARLFMTWTLQGLWVVLTAGAALAAMTSGSGAEPGVFTLVGVAIWLIGFGIEVAADAQKRAFRSDPGNEGRFITGGLWAWSRHPNYFGEITLWIGIALISLPALSGWQYATLVSPVFVALLLTRISGVPMLEARARRRWGDESAYRDYVARTPVLIPRPPRER